MEEVSLTMMSRLRVRMLICCGKFFVTKEKKWNYRNKKHHHLKMQILQLLPLMAKKLQLHPYKVKLEIRTTKKIRKIRTRTQIMIMIQKINQKPPDRSRSYLHLYILRQIYFFKPHIMGLPSQV